MEAVDPDDILLSAEPPSGGIASTGDCSVAGGVIVPETGGSLLAEPCKAASE